LVGAHTSIQVDELTKVFANIFGYDVQELELPATNAQLTLNSRVSTWACEHNSTDNLLIVYYAGHGIWDTDLGVLEFAPYAIYRIWILVILLTFVNRNNDPSNRNRASWNTCEQQLREAVDADVFGIMDCCYASNLNRNVIELSRTYEMLAASGIDDLTPQPGRNSFTHRLIKHLKELVVDNSPGYFTTRHIEDRMKKDRIGGKVKPLALWCYSSSSRHIRLSKLKPVEERLKRNRTMPSHSRFLHLGFALEREDFDEQNIERLTKALPGILKDAGAPVVDIKWLGCRKVGGRTFKELAEYVLKHRENLSAISPGQSAKRSAEEAGLDELSSCDGGSVMHRGPRPKFVTEATV
jgi:hypothetical protein